MMRDCEFVNFNLFVVS